MNELYVYNDEDSIPLTIKTPKYYCEKHGVVENVNIFNTLSYGQKLICPKCYEEMILNQCKTLEVFE
jgi:hypothetical protein